MKCPGKRMRHLIKHLGIIHNDLAGSCLDLIINLVTTSARQSMKYRPGNQWNITQAAMKYHPGSNEIFPQAAMKYFKYCPKQQWNKLNIAQATNEISPRLQWNIVNIAQAGLVVTTLMIKSRQLPARSLCIMPRCLMRCLILLPGHFIH